MKTLITGSNGFVGMNIALALLRRGQGVIFSFRSKFPEEYKEMLAQYGDLVEYSQGDLMDKAYYDELEQLDFNAIINGAMVTVTTRSELEALAFEAETNMVCHIRLLDLARKKNIMRFTYISSSGVYGITPPDENPYDLIIEDVSPLRNPGVYGITKIASEGLLRHYASLTGAKCASVRVPAVYGPFERVTASRNRMSSVYNLAHLALAGEEAVVFGKDRVRDWTYADDVGDAVAMVHLNDNRKYDVYNIATGVNYTLEQLVNATAKAVPGFKYRYTDDVSEANVFLTNNQSHLSIARLQEDTGFVPQYDIEKGIARYIEILRAEQK